MKNDNPTAQYCTKAATLLLFEYINFALKVLHFIPSYSSRKMCFLKFNAIQNYTFYKRLLQRSLLTVPVVKFMKKAALRLMLV